MKLTSDIGAYSSSRATSPAPTQPTQAEEAAADRRRDLQPGRLRAYVLRARCCLLVAQRFHVARRPTQVMSSPRMAHPIALSPRSRRILRS